MFGFRGVSAYLEAALCQITTPRFEILQIRLFKQLTLSVPRLPQFMNTTENLRFNEAVIMFKDKYIDVRMGFREANTYVFGVWVDCWLSQVFSTVEHLTLGHELHSQSSEEHNDVDQVECRNLLRSFSNVKTLLVKAGLVEELSHCLRLENGGLPLELLPELQELTYFFKSRCR